MYKSTKIAVLAALTVLLILTVNGCKQQSQERESVSDEIVPVEITESPPVSGWLDVALPAAPRAMDAVGDQLCVLTDEGIVMCWDGAQRKWSALLPDTTLASLGNSFDVCAEVGGVAVLDPSVLYLFDSDEVTELPLPGEKEPVELCATDSTCAVLFRDGSLYTIVGDTLVSLVEPSGKNAIGGLCYGEGVFAWLNEDTTFSTFSGGPVLQNPVPDGSNAIAYCDSSFFVSDGDFVYRYLDTGSWEKLSSGTVVGDGILYSGDAVTILGNAEEIAKGLSEKPEEICRLDNGTAWAMTDGALAVWAEIGEVETRIPEADILMMRYRVAGQTGGGSPDASGVGDPNVSLGGVFRIYESVSSRPDPFTEFPLSSRNLRRSVSDLTIEELHLVGITVDPSAGNQAMVEDANGVPYILNEGTVLRNNTHIADITANEVIVVQEVSVGSEDAVGGVASIPTIFSIRLHEEGGL